MLKHLVCRMYNTSKLMFSTTKNWKFKSSNTLCSNTNKEMTIVSRILLEKLIAFQIYNKFCDFLGNKVLITATIGRTMWLTSDDTDALQAYRLEFSWLAVAWRECHFSRQQEAYPGGGTVLPLPFPLSYPLILTVLNLCYIGLSWQWVWENLLPYNPPVPYLLPCRQLLSALARFLSSMNM